MERITDLKNCKLSNCGCNMVVAATQDSINATMKEYLDTVKSNLVTQAYCSVFDENDNITYISRDYNDVIKHVGMDLFDIPAEKDKRTEAHEKALEMAYDEMGLEFAFRFQIGLPEADDPTSLRDIIKLIESDITSIANVEYTMYLKTFEIIKIAERRRTYIFTKMVQDKNNPWYIVSEVKLDMQGQEFESLPKHLQDKLKPKDADGNLKMDDVLSVQQLYMNLNTARFTDGFKVEGLDPKDDIYALFQQVFLNSYVEDCKKNGEIILGYLAKQFPPNTSTLHEFVKLRDFNFCISPYFDKDGKSDEKKQGLYTLNYLFSTGKPIDTSAFAYSKRFNWIDESEKASVHGRMAIDRENLLGKISKNLEPALEDLNLIVKTTASIGFVKISYSMNINNDSTPVNVKFEKKTYTDVNNNVYDCGYFFSHESSHEDYDRWTINTVHTSLKYTASSVLVFSNNRIVFETKIWCHAKLKIMGGVTEGVICNKVISYGINLEVNQFGKIVIVPDNDMFEKDESGNVKSDTWSTINTLFGAKETFKKQKERLNKKINSFKTKSKELTKEAFSDLNFWAFPGGRVFSFKDPFFSTSGDILTSLTYVAPSDEGKN